MILIVLLPAMRDKKIRGVFMLDWMAEHMLHPSFFISLAVCMVIIFIITCFFYALMKLEQEKVE